MLYAKYPISRENNYQYIATLQIILFSTPRFSSGRSPSSIVRRRAAFVFNLDGCTSTDSYDRRPGGGGSRRYLLSTSSITPIASGSSAPASPPSGFTDPSSGPAGSLSAMSRCECRSSTYVQSGWRSPPDTPVANPYRGASAELLARSAPASVRMCTFYSSNPNIGCLLAPPARRPG